MPRPTLAREIAAVLAFKAVALTALYFAFFAPDEAKRVSPNATAEALFGPPQVPPAPAPPAEPR